VGATESHQEQARRAAERAQRLLAQPVTLDTYDWGLVATLILEADEALGRAQDHDPSITLPLLETVLEELRDVTSDFTSPAFVKATKPERRQKPRLFAPRR
jgi:hypothetical protein